ncbi:MAG: ferritin family protein [Actinomycetota bacterium]|nr:ferritin family protein [Actinomycetota bacterium]
MIDIKKIIEAAIEEERKAQVSYQKAADAAQDPETKAFFEQLVKDELSHEKRLRDRLMAIKLIQDD